MVRPVTRWGRYGVALVAGMWFAASVAAAQGETHYWSAGVLPSGIASLSAISCQPIAGSQRCVSVGENAVGSGASIVVGGDGGGSWQSEQAPPGVTGLFGVSCVSVQRCWAVGTSASGTQGVVADTQDGGATWVTEFMPFEVSEIDRISCDANTCLATGGSLAGQVLVTNDDGVTWTLHKLPGTYIATNVAAASATVAYAVGGDQCGGPGVKQCPGAIWRSSDSGSTWQLVKQGIPFGDAISCADVTHCLAASATTSTGAIEATSDGGHHWHPQKLPRFKGFFNGISCYSSDCVAVGQNAAGTAPFIMRTSDSGGHWALDSSPPATGALYGAATTGSRAAQVVGQNPARTAARVLEVQGPIRAPRSRWRPGGAPLSALQRVAGLSSAFAANLRAAFAAICNAQPVGCGPNAPVFGAHVPFNVSALQNAAVSLDRYASAVSEIERSVGSLLAAPATRQAKVRMAELATRMYVETSAEFTELSDLGAAGWEGTDANRFNQELPNWNHEALSAIQRVRDLAR